MYYVVYNCSQLQTSFLSSLLIQVLKKENLEKRSYCLTMHLIRRKSYIMIIQFCVVVVRIKNRRNWWHKKRKKKEERTKPTAGTIRLIFRPNFPLCNVREHWCCCAFFCLHYTVEQIFYLLFCWFTDWRTKRNSKKKKRDGKKHIVLH